MKNKLKNTSGKSPFNSGFGGPRRFCNRRQFNRRRKYVIYDNG